MKKSVKPILVSLLFLGLISAFFFFLTYEIENGSRRTTLEEVNNADLSTTKVFIHSGICEQYPNKLYTPQNFIGDQPKASGESAMYCTYRVVLSFPAGKTYGISGHNGLLVIYVFSMLKVKAPKWQIASFWALVSGVILYYAIAPSTVYSYYQQPIVVYCLAVLAGTVCILRYTFCQVDLHFTHR